MKFLNHFSSAILAIVMVLSIAMSSTLSVQGGHKQQPVENSAIYLPLISRSGIWSQVDPSGQTVIFWHNNSGYRETVLQNFANQFNNTNEWGITVVPVNKGSYSNIFNSLLPILNTPDVPGLVVSYQNQMATYQLADGLLDMTSLVKEIPWGLSSTDIADFPADVYTQDIFPLFDDARQGFPQQRSMEVLYYNMDWITELGYSAPPATPEEFKAMACKAVAQPFSRRIGQSSKGYELSIDTSRFASWTFAFGGDIFDSQVKQYTFNSLAAVNAMTFLQGMFNDGCAVLMTESYGDQTDFGNGALLFAIGSSSGINYFGSAVNAGAQFTWDVGALPHTTINPTMNVYGASISIPRQAPERELAAWLFLKYLTSTDNQETWTRTTGYLPTRMSTAAGLADYFVANPKFATAFNLLPYSRSEPSTPGYDFVRSEVNLAMVEIMNGADVVTRLNELNVKANQILAEQMGQR